MSDQISMRCFAARTTVKSVLRRQNIPRIAEKRLKVNAAAEGEKYFFSSKRSKRAAEEKNVFASCTVNNLRNIKSLKK